MKSHKYKRKWEITLSVLMALVLLLLSIQQAAPVPVGPQILSQSTETATPRSATEITTAGGTITTMVLNGTTQNPHWKAYVGNVTGKLALQDAQNHTIYDWGLSTVSGEVYVSRDNGIDWTQVECANETHLESEETTMSHTSGAVDSIRNTFNQTTHDPFYVGSVLITANECNYTTTTYVNSTKQSQHFQEIALYDNTTVVYATIIEDDLYGFDNNTYDFQLIVPEKGWDGPVSSTPYYFYVELI